MKPPTLGQQESADQLLTMRRAVTIQNQLGVI